MIEARVKCLCTQYTVPDLGLVLHKGEETWIDAARARKSADLRVAVNARAVQVQWAQRCSVARPPLPPFVSRIKNRLSPKPPVPAPAVAPAPVAEPLAPSPEETARLLAESMRAVVQDEIRKALQQHVGAPVDKAAIAEVVRAAVSDIAVRADAKAPAAKPARQADEPLFIPTGIVPTTAQPALNVASEIGEAAGVDDAAAALKAARTKKKKEQ